MDLRGSSRRGNLACNKTLFALGAVKFHIKSKVMFCVNMHLVHVS